MPWLTPNSLPTNPANVVCRQLLIPNRKAIVAAVNGALFDLTIPENWEQFGSVTPVQMAAAMQEMFFSYLDSACMIGAIIPLITQTLPPNCLPCNGTVHQRTDYPRLYDALDPVYIVDAATFRTPDLRGQFVLGAGAGVGYPRNTTGGAAQVTLTPGQMPTHSHLTQPHDHTTLPHTHTEIPAVSSVASVLPPPDVIPSAVPGAGLTGPATVIVNPSTVTVDNSGNDEAHENMPPYTALRYAVVAR